MSLDLKPILKATHAYLCIDCGKCTGACPVSQQDDSFSPRRLVAEGVGGRNGGPARAAVDRCLTCGLCSLRCPADVKYLEFTRSLRALQHGIGQEHACSHGGLLADLMRLMATGSLQQSRLDWVPEGARTAREGELLYFVGCLPYFDAAFRGLEIDALSIAKSTLAVLNAAGETPVVMESELCCGHDLYWSGDEDGARRLGERNVAAIAERGARTVVTACAECASMLRVQYPKLLGRPMPFAVSHLSEFIAAKRAEGKLAFKARGDGREKAETAVFHDPCRLARHLGETEAPRAALREVYGGHLAEMPRWGVNAACCGTSGWLRCDSVSRRLQGVRLREAEAAGARTLVTACPKCQIHFRCAQAGETDGSLKGLRIRDLATVVAAAIDGG